LLCGIHLLARKKEKKKEWHKKEKKDFKISNFFSKRYGNRGKSVL
jgi:hypothetical protein